MAEEALRHRHPLAIGRQRRQQRAEQKKGEELEGANGPKDAHEFRALCEAIDRTKIWISYHVAY